MLKRSLELYPTLVEYIAILQPACVQIREMWQMGIRPIGAHAITLTSDIQLIPSEKDKGIKR